MKIAVVHNFYRSESPSGENIAVLEQSKVLEDEGHEVKLFSTSSDDMSQKLLSLTDYSIKVAKGKTSVPDLVQTILDFSPDIVHVHNTFPMIGTSWLNLVQCPIVSTLHNFRTVCSSGLLTRNNQECLLCPEKSSLNAILHSCYRDSALKSIPLSIATRASGSKSVLLNRSDVLVVLSEYAEKIYKRYSTNEKLICKVPNFSPLEIGDLTKSGTRESWVYIGRLSSEKGILELVQSWPEDQNLKIFGTGELQSQIAKVASKKANLEVCGSVSRSDLAGVLGNSKGLVFPSTCRENLPMVYVEALSTGTPVVAFGGNSVAELVRGDSSGTVFDAWSDLPLALKRLSESRDYFAGNALLASNNNYSKSSWYKKILTVYEIAIAHHGGSGKL